VSNLGENRILQGAVTTPIEWFKRFFFKMGGINGVPGRFHGKDLVTWQQLGSSIEAFHALELCHLVLNLFSSLSQISKPCK